MICNEGVGGPDEFEDDFPYSSERVDDVDARVVRYDLMLGIHSWQLAVISNVCDPYWASTPEAES